MAITTTHFYLIISAIWMLLSVAMLINLIHDYKCYRIYALNPDEYGKEKIHQEYLLYKIRSIPKWILFIVVFFTGLAILLSKATVILHISFLWAIWSIFLIATIGVIVCLNLGSREKFKIKEIVAILSIFIIIAACLYFSV